MCAIDDSHPIECAGCIKAVFAGSRLMKNHSYVFVRLIPGPFHDSPMRDYRSIQLDAARLRVSELIDLGNSDDATRVEGGN